MRRRADVHLQGVLAGEDTRSLPLYEESLVLTAIHSVDSTLQLMSRGTPPPLCA